MTDDTINTENRDAGGNSGPADTSRRQFLRNAALGAAGGAVIGGAPYIGDAQAQDGIRLRIQSSWQPGTVGYKTFEKWAARVQELTSGEVRVEPFPAGAVVGDFDMPDAVRDGVIEGQNM